MFENSEIIYLGLDLSTQKLKAIIIDDNLKPLHTEQVQFDSELPEFRTHGGVLRSKECPSEVTAPVLMWLKALDMLLDKLVMSGIDLANVASISGSAQQHGSVYWQKNADQLLANLNCSEFLHIQLANCFSVLNSPVWMDSSTTKQCKDLEHNVGGPERLANITGSRAYERFTAAQIKKIFEHKPEAYAQTDRISLISNFVCSLFCGRIVQMDFSDACGMNLYDIKNKSWDISCIQACAPDLQDKLGEPVNSKTCLGNVSNYFVERFGFASSCKVIVFTGDNPSSLAGMGLGDDWLAVSLGTSDTVFMSLQQPQVLLDGHILCNPLDENGYMAMLCFRNGSLSREKIRNASADSSWDIFNSLLDMTPRGNFGNFGLYYHTREILPSLEGEYRYNKAGVRVKRYSSNEVEVRAIIEGQCIARKAHAQDIGFKFTSDTKILATGGASNNKSVLQVLADVFNAPVYTQDVPDSAVLGAAYRAKYGLLDSQNPGQCKYWDVIKPPSPVLVCEPYTDSDSIYIPMLERYRKIVRDLLQDHADN